MKCGALSTGSEGKSGEEIQHELKNERSGRLMINYNKPVCHREAWWNSTVQDRLKAAQKKLDLAENRMHL